MKSIPPTLQAKLDGGVTTLSRCWTVTRKDGTRLGFTEHDETLMLNGIAHEPDAGLSAGALESASGLASDNTDVIGALSSDAITETDLERGVYDGAEVDVTLVDWTEPTDNVILFRGNIGETTRGPAVFSAELRSLAAKLDQPMGRAYLTQCDAALGDERCHVILTPTTATVTAISPMGEITAIGLREGHARGLLTWISGSNAGTTHPVRDQAGEALMLWAPPSDPIQPGDVFEVTQGCDKTLATCRDRFDNVENFQGFPHIPGDDFATSYPNRGEGNDGVI